MQLLDALFSTVAPSRWESAELPADEIVDRPRFAAPCDPAEVLRQRARQVRQRLDDNADVARRQAAEALAAGVVGRVMKVVEIINAELGAVLCVGLTLSAARPGRKQFGLVLSNRAGGRRRLEYSLHIRPEGGELSVVADRLGRSAELARANIEDPQAGETLRSAIETFLLEAAERFAADAAP